MRDAHALPALLHRRLGRAQSCGGGVRATRTSSLGRLTRMITGTLDPHLARYPDDEWAQLASAQLTGVHATLAQLTK